MNEWINRAAESHLQGVVLRARTHLLTEVYTDVSGSNSRSSKVRGYFISTSL